MSERRKIPDEELVEISGGIDLSLEDLEARRRESARSDQEKGDTEVDPGGPGPAAESADEGGGNQSLS